MEHGAHFLILYYPRVQVVMLEAPHVGSSGEVLRAVVLALLAQGVRVLALSLCDASSSPLHALRMQAPPHRRALLEHCDAASATAVQVSESESE